MKKCKQCGKKFIKKYSYSKNYWKTKKFCSRDCYGKSKKGVEQWFKRIDKNPNRHSKEEKLCECGCKTLIKRYDYRGREKKYLNGHTQIGKNRPDVSDMMKGNKYGKKLSGKNHWNWKGGKTSENRILREQPRYKKWRLKVYKKYQWTCQICKIHCQKGNIVAHHKKTWNEYPKLRYIVSNGIVLCRSCHKKVHKEIGFKKNGNNLK